MRLKIEINPYLLFPTPDRFSGTGYRPPISFNDALDKILSIEDLDGIGLHYPSIGNEERAKELNKKIQDRGKKIGTFGIDYWSKEWGLGSFSANDEKIRKNAVDVAKKAIDVANLVGADRIFIWLAHDGTEYAFQRNFAKAWDWMVDGLRKVTNYDPKMKIGIEYKIREPTTHCFISTIGDVFNLIDEVKTENLGATVDLGHALMAGERIACSITRCLRRDVLHIIHWGDNYRGWDDDLIVGTVNVIDFLETMFWLKKFEWDGWNAIDMVAFKNDAFAGGVEAVRWIRGFEKFVDDIGLEKLEQTINEDPSEFSKLVRTYFFGK